MATRSIPKAKTGWRRLIYFQAYFIYPPILSFLLYRATNKIALPSFVIAILAGLIFWMVIEYLLHRIVFHGEDRGQWWGILPWAHHAHHRHPREISLILAPVWLSLPISIIIWCLLRGLLGNWHLSIVVLAGIWSGYLWYEFVHYSAHCRLPKTRLMKYLKTYHLLHHHTTESIWFGVTSPMIDKFMGTYRQLPGKAKRRIAETGEQKYAESRLVN